MKKKERRNSNIREALRDNDDDEKYEDTKTELEIQGSERIEETKRKENNENKIENRKRME